MGRFKGRLKLQSGKPVKRDTPLKTAPKRRDKCRRFLPRQHYETLLEEPEVERTVTAKPARAVGLLTRPACAKSVFGLSSPAFTANPRGRSISAAGAAKTKYVQQRSPADPPSIPRTPRAGAFNDRAVHVKEEEKHSAVTPESLTSPSVDSDTTFSSEEEEEEEDDEDDASTSTASSSFPSPEIFRKESHADVWTLPSMDDLLSIRNSTLLDVSHAKTIHMHPHPNLSTIIDTSAITENISEFKRPDNETRGQTDQVKSDEAFKWKTTANLINRRPIVVRKKVCFKSPIVDETCDAKTKEIIQDAGEPVHASSPPEQIMAAAETSTPITAPETGCEEETLRLMVTLKRPIKSKPEKVKFFDFIDDSEQDAFFQGMRERCAKLRNAPLFPLSAARLAEPAVL